MSDCDPRHDATGRWLRYARADLGEARLNITHGGEPYIACFHAQQAVEKAIKAAYVWQGERFERLHDLDRLRGMLPGDWAFKKSFPDLSDLSVWAVEGRYPETADDATAAEACVAVTTAEAVVSSIVNDLITSGYADLEF